MFAYLRHKIVQNAIFVLIRLDIIWTTKKVAIEIMLF
jgi:hypothetical protein